MNREELISKMMDMANKINEWTRDEEEAIWTLCSDWNMTHPDEEIFMCEHENDNHKIDGFYIEDDYWVFEE